MPWIVERNWINELYPVLRHGRRGRTSDKSVESLFGCRKRAVQIAVELKLGIDGANIPSRQNATVNVAAAHEFEDDRRCQNAEEQNNAQNGDRASHGAIHLTRKR